MKTRTVVIVALAIFLVGLLVGERGKAQTAVPPFQMTVGSGLHTSCAVAANTTTFCFAADGLWQSLNGAAYVQLTPSAPAGVTSITVCGVSGTSCGTPQTGAVSINVPKVATTTITATAATALQ